MISYVYLVYQALCSSCLQCLHVSALHVPLRSLTKILNWCQKINIDRYVLCTLKTRVTSKWPEIKLLLFVYLFPTSPPPQKKKHAPPPFTLTSDSLNFSYCFDWWPLGIFFVADKSTIKRSNNKKSIYFDAKTRYADHVSKLLKLYHI